MASALVGGLLAHGQPREEIAVVEVNISVARDFHARWGVTTVSAIPENLEGISTLVLAVKPQQIPGVLHGCPALSDTVRVISIAAGVTTQQLSQGLRGHGNIVRAMPNTPALVRAGVTGLFAREGVSQEDRDHATALMHAVGSVHWLDQEAQMDALTAISGSGPAYVFLLMEALQRAAESQGFDAHTAQALVEETVRGAALLACSGHEDPGVLRQRVTSPGGTTAAAVRVLEEGQWFSLVGQAVAAATQRSRELAQVDGGAAK